MGSNSKKRQSFAKLARERAVKERRELKQAKKDDRKHAEAELAANGLDSGLDSGDPSEAPAE